MLEVSSANDVRNFNDTEGGSHCFNGEKLYYDFL